MTMDELLQIGILPILLTLGGYQLGAFLQKKTRSALCNPILVAVAVVLIFTKATGMDVAQYREGTERFSWLLTPATVSLAIPMYEHLDVLKRDRWAVIAGIVSGAVSCLCFVLLFGVLAGFQRELTISLLPKSVTTAIGVPLSQLSGGIPSVTTAAIVFTGIFTNVMSVVMIRLFRLRHPVAQGVALGTAGHVVGTAKANEIGELTGAVSSLSLVVAGLLTAVVFPLVMKAI